MKTIMETVKVEMEIPRDVLFAARIDEEKASLELKKQLAVHLFEMELISLGKAAEFAGIPRWDFMNLLGNLKIPLHYSVEDWEKDKQTLKGLLK
jgi:predicted HTH domain antitoxin